MCLFHFISTLNIILCCPLRVVPCLGATFEMTPTLNESAHSVHSPKGQGSASGSDDEEMKEIARKINALSLGSEGEESDGEADDEGREEEEEEEEADSDKGVG